MWLISFLIYSSLILCRVDSHEASKPLDGDGSSDEKNHRITGPLQFCSVFPEQMLQYKRCSVADFEFVPCLNSAAAAGEDGGDDAAASGGGGDLTATLACVCPAKKRLVRNVLSYKLKNKRITDSIKCMNSFKPKSPNGSSSTNESESSTGDKSTHNKDADKPADQNGDPNDDEEEEDSQESNATRDKNADENGKESNEESDQDQNTTDSDSDSDSNSKGQKSIQRSAEVKDDEGDEGCFEAYCRDCPFGLHRSNHKVNLVDCDALDWSIITLLIACASFLVIFMITIVIIVCCKK
ncbi:MAG: hypothetical protein MHMPM18_000258 [Marteilia pararefringens]